ncbi:ABC transporter permease YtrF [Lysinibacillus alkalisoli]|uniref:ABC transporter permease YtrF n=1 Tax=Lysinibacillus alkalisoli TaxID=1911548 RepID=A0A917G4Z8_9BACI|nr:FtsX-like permease family protein [Lysinibacillus alkalisoli]GGG22926.1 ABC transporter permease YtrF [Lysinibacillus alkalisoli]
MLFKDQIAFVRQHIRKNKMRVFMTVLAATIGCAFLIVLASVGFGIQQTMNNEILQDEQVTRIQFYDQNATTEDLDKIKQQDHVKAVLKHTTVHYDVTASLKDRDVYTTNSFYDMKDYQAVKGKLFAGTYPKNDKEVIVGYHFAQGLLNEKERNAISDAELNVKEGEQVDYSKYGYQGDIIGQTISVAFKDQGEEGQTLTETFKVVGVTDKPSYDWQRDTSLIFSDQALPMIEKTFTKTEDNISAEYVIHVDHMENVMPLLKKLKDDGYHVYSVLEQMDQINMFFFVFKAGLIFVGTIAVLISSIGIFNTMTMAVTERTREIGVLKAIGASPKLIQRLFLMESAFIGILGTVLAVILSYIISIIVNITMPLILQAATNEDTFTKQAFVFSVIPWQLVVIAATISIGVAMISGWRPARKATKIDVIQALRQEL